MAPDEYGISAHIFHELSHRQRRGDMHTFHSFRSRITAEYWNASSQSFTIAFTMKDVCVKHIQVLTSTSTSLDLVILIDSKNHQSLFKNLDLVEIQLLAGTSNLRIFVMDLNKLYRKQAIEWTPLEERGQSKPKGRWRWTFWAHPKSTRKMTAYADRWSKYIR